MSKLYDFCFRSVCVDPTSRCRAVEEYKSACLKVGVTASPAVRGCVVTTPSLTKPPPTIRPTVTTSGGVVPTTPASRCDSDPEYKRRVVGFCNDLMFSPFQNAQCSQVCYFYRCKFMILMVQCSCLLKI